MTDNAAPDGSVRIERTLDAPIETVWKMWAEAEHFASWYGPMGATIPTANMDVKVGGSRLICMAMETPNGPMQMWFSGEYREVTPNERLVYTEGMSDENGNAKTAADMGMPEGTPMSTEVVVELAAAGDGTQMVMTHVGVPADSPGGGGWMMAIDKLAEYVTTA